MPTPDLGVSDLLLKLVDTPGFLDSSGGKQNIENNKTVKKYREEMGAYFPNFVIITISATDNRFEDSNSSFVKSLRLLKKSKFVDENKLNAICVITNALGINVKKGETWKTKMDERKCKVGQQLKKVKIQFWEENYIFILGYNVSA